MKKAFDAVPVPRQVVGFLPCVTGSQRAIEFGLTSLVVTQDDDRMCLGAFRNDDEAESFLNALGSGDIESPDWDRDDLAGLTIMHATLEGVEGEPTLGDGYTVDPEECGACTACDGLCARHAAFWEGWNACRTYIRGALEVDDGATIGRISTLAPKDPEASA